ncbi:MAG: redoxin domain-containing protein [Azospirillaceae bacterium]|nr:redoxin domain-containing protein [Azospirillaceae bacterium]
MKITEPSTTRRSLLALPLALAAMSALAGFGAGLMSFAGTAGAAPRPGTPAPDFTGVDSNAQTLRLSDFQGKLVVLEWTNDGCPFVGKWYQSGAMQQLQRDATARGAVWLSVISSAPGQQGFVDGGRANQLTQERNAAPSRVLLDPRGVIGHLYDARTTPEIFVIAPDGTLAYMGGADSIASTREEDLAKAEPFAREAIFAVFDGKPVLHPVTRPYGCTVKYAD